MWSLNNDHLRSSLLLIKLGEERQALADAKAENMPVSAQKQIKRCIDRCYAEIVRRVSVALAVFTFTLMGASFGIGISRNQSNKGLFIVIAFGAFTLVAFLAAKGIDHLLIPSSALYLFPHVLIIVASLWTLRRVAQGIE